MIKFQIWLIIFCTVFACTSIRKVSFRIEAQQQYCGGARPSPDVAKALLSPVPYANRKMVLVNGVGKPDTLQTDSAGHIALNLKPGRYRLFEFWRYTKSAPSKKDLSAFDHECLSAEWKKANKVILVTRSSFQVLDSTAIVQYCDWKLPCILEDTNSPVPD